MKQLFDKNLTANGAIIAVSGGADSMVLLTLASRQINGFTVVTVNHHLRRNAENDARLVRDYCNKLGVSCITVDIYPKAFAEQTGMSIETAARVLRYDALNVLADGKPIFLAHNKNDQAETVLMHLTRGSGNKGAVGMNDGNAKRDQNYFRPLIDWTRDDILRFAAENNVPYATDKTNFDNKYSRNFVRNKIIPLLTKLNANAIGNIARFSQISATDEDYFDSILNELYPTLKITAEPNLITIPLSVFDLHAAIKNRALLRAFWAAGYKKDVEQIHLDDLTALAKNTVGKKLSLPFDLTAIKDYNSVNILKNVTTNAAPNAEIPFFIGEKSFDGQTLVICENGEGLRFDGSKIPDTAILRYRKDGDIFTKFGGGTKKLKEYLIDKKIPSAKRNAIPLIADGNEILLIFGVEISDKIKIDNTTKTVLFAKIINK